MKKRKMVKKMRSEHDLMSQFRTNEEAGPGYQRERVMLEVLLDVRSLLVQLKDLEADEKNWRDSTVVAEPAPKVLTDAAV